jgi:hypothetical protein
MYGDFYDLRVRDAAGNLLWEKSSPDRPDFVALDTWDVVLDAGRDPAYTVRIYYATLFPLATGKHDLKNRLAPDEVADFVAHEFASIVRDTWHTQFEAWGFGKPIHREWDPDRVVEVIITDPPFALFDGIGTHTVMVYKDGLAYPQRRIWWLSTANSSFRDYDTLANAYKVAFAHEFFHLMQWNVLLSAGCHTDMWSNVFIEGQAVLAPSVQYPELELSGAHGSWSSTMYLRSVMRFLITASQGSFKQLEADPGNKYAAAPYWRFLYEQYGGMDIIRAALEEMACGYDPDIVAGMPGVMDRAFQRVDGPFHTFEESVIAFARANYALRLENGRCAKDDHFDFHGDCHGFYYDPAGAYATPLLQDELRYAGEPLAVDGAVENSFATDFIELSLDPELHGQLLTVRLQQEGSVARFNVQVWKLGAGETKPRAATPQPETVAQGSGGAYTYTIKQLDTTKTQRLALIIVRLDAAESMDPLGRYRIVIRET